MALAIDGYWVLKTIGKNAKIFPDIRFDVNKQASLLIGKQVKKSDVENLRAIYDALGSDNFSKVVDQLNGIGPILKRMDKHNPDLKGMLAQHQRKLLSALACGDVQPKEKPAKAKSPKKKTKKEKEGIMDFESMKPRER
jgi:hypothetical protein